LLVPIYFSRDKNIEKFGVFKRVFGKDGNKKQENLQLLNIQMRFNC